MEIAPVPHRAARGEWRRLALGIVVLVPVVLLVLLPAVLRLDRFVLTDDGMDGTLGRGSVVLAQDVASTDLRVGDVISFRLPDQANDQADDQSDDQSDDQVARRIVAIEDGRIVTQADSTGVADPWTLPLDDTTYSRVSVGVPWIGYPFVVDGGWVLLAVAAVAALALALTMGRKEPQTVVKPARARLPVG